jgi:hypothetical protein
MWLRILAVSVVATWLCASIGTASVIINFAQVGNNVTAIGSGTVNTASLNFFTNIGAQDALDASSGEYLGGTAGGSTDVYEGISGPGNFGPGNGQGNSPTTSSGDYIGLTAFNDRLFVPGGYVSGSPLSNISTWQNATFASLGLTPGSYIYTWGSGPSADSLTVNVVVPEPSAAILCLCGMIFVLLCSRGCVAGHHVNSRSRFA